MTLISKGKETLSDGKVVARRYLRCSAAHRSLGCSNRVTFEYSQVERALLDKILHLVMDDQHFAQPKPVAKLRRALVLAKRSLAEANRKKEIAYSALEEDGEDHLAREKYRLRKEEGLAAKRDVDQIEKEILDASGAVSPTEHVRRVVEVRALMEDENESVRYEARSRVKLALNDLVEGIRFSGRKNRWTLIMANGSRSITFTRSTGEVGFEVDWLTRRPDWVRRDGEAMKNYIRRHTGAA